jgi:hypothetical protein
MFIYYIIYKAWNLISFGLTQMKYRTAFTISLFTAMNLYVILKFCGVNIEFKDNIYAFIFLILWTIGHLLIFANERLHQKIIDTYGKKDIPIKVVYLAITMLYVGLSIYLVANINK